MKFLMNLILIYCLLITSVFAQSVNPNDQLKLGKPSSVSDKGIVFDTNDGVSNKKLLVEKISKKLKWDGNTVQIGDGSSSSDKELIIAGALKSLKYNGTTGEFEFNDDVKLSASLKTDFLQAVNSEVAINSLLRATQGIKVGSGANEIRVNAGNLEFSNDGTLFKKFGTGTGGSSTGTTILDNASFEDGISTNWTSSGGTFTQGTYTNGVEGNTKYAQFVATGAGQYFETALFSVPTNFSGGCQADFKKVNVSANDLFKVEVLDSSANILSAGNVKASSWVKFPTINFTCPTAGTQIKLRVTSLSAGTIQVDDAYLGSNQNIVNLNQAKLIGSVTITGCTTNWGTTSTTFAEFPTQTGCSYSTNGLALAPSTNIPAIKFANLPAGDYRIEYEGALRQGSANFVGYYQFWDGVNTAREVSAHTNQGGTIYTSGISQTISYATAQSNITLSMRGKTDSGGNAGPFGTNSIPGVIKVWYFPAGQETAVSAEQASWFIDANIGGANPTMPSASSTYTEVINSNLDLVINSTKGSSPVEIACSNGNASTGLTCTTGQESLGISFVPGAGSGLYEVCAVSGFSLSSGDNYTFQLVETPNTSLTILQEGGQRSFVTSASAHVMRNCGVFNFSDTSKRTVRLMFESTASTVGSTFSLDRSATSGQRDMNWTVRPLLSAFNRPILTGDQVRTPGLSNPLLFSARVDTSAVISREYGEWLNTCSGTGTKTCTFSTPFLSIPNCWVESEAGSGAPENQIEPVTSTTQVQYTTNASAGGVTNTNALIFCHGVR